MLIMIALLSKSEAINLLQNANSSEESITFCDIETEKHRFHYCKDPIFVEDVDIDKIL